MSSSPEGTGGEGSGHPVTGMSIDTMTGMVIFFHRHVTTRYEKTASRLRIYD
jgi:hypothetical protein